MDTEHTNCSDCHSRPRVGPGRWLCEECELDLFRVAQAVSSGADETSVDLRILTEEQIAA